MGGWDLRGTAILRPPPPIPGKAVARDLWEGVSWEGGEAPRQERGVWAFPPLWLSVG